MAWNDLTFVDCSLLTAAKMSQLQGNFAGFAAGEPGAPPLHIDGVSSLAAVHASSGMVAPRVSSFGTLHAASGFVGPNTSSLGALYVGSGLVATQVGSFGTLHVGSGIVAPQVSSFGILVTQLGWAQNSAALVHFKNVETLVCTVSMPAHGNRVSIVGGGTAGSSSLGQGMRFRIRVGSAGGTLLYGRAVTFGNANVDFNVVAFHLPDSGAASYALTAVNESSANSAYAAGVVLIAEEKPFR